MWPNDISSVADNALFKKRTPHPTIQRSQIAAPRWPNNISSVADNALFKNRAQNIECRFGCVARSAVLLKPNVANILLFNFCEQKFVQYGPITIAIDCYGLSLFFFVAKWPNYGSGPKSAPNSNSYWVRRHFNVYVQKKCFKCDNFACLHTRQHQNELHLKRWFFFGIFYKSSAGPLPSVVQAYTQPYSFGVRRKLIICQLNVFNCQLSLACPHK